jgi:hypothetical protein
MNLLYISLRILFKVKYMYTKSLLLFSLAFRLPLGFPLLRTHAWGSRFVQYFNNIIGIKACGLLPMSI